MQSPRAAKATFAPALGDLAALARKHALHRAPDEWLATIDDAEALLRWADATPTTPARVVMTLMAEGLAGCGANPVPSLLALPEDDLAQRLVGEAADALIAAPQWQGQCWETGPLARAARHPLVAAVLSDFGNGLLAHLAALLVELARAAEVLESSEPEGAEYADTGVDHSDLRDPTGGGSGIDTPGFDDRAAESGAAVSSAVEPFGKNSRSGEFPAGALPERPAASASPPESASEAMPRAADANSVLDGATSANAASATPTWTRTDSDTGNAVIPASGVALADAARGALLHRVEVADGLVQRYQILAPTEWNFHPDGVVAQGLERIARSGVGGTELERLARLYITAVDPCVEYRLSVS
jgi:hypothetical protein